MKPWLIILLFILVGAGIGSIYYLFFGCTGSCPITSSPYRTMIYFGLLGGLLSGVFLPEKKKNQ